LHGFLFIYIFIHFVLFLLLTDKPGLFIEALDSDIPGITDTPYYRGA